ncbi:MAG: tetratricopeptide repeat protein [Legionellales bacterium]|nr:tetratricopeptide repeat protein [Legionellales bacterium]
MSDYLTDEEQWQRIKTFWQYYGSWILIAVLTVTLVVFGWRWLEQRQLAQATEGSIIYQQLLVSLAEQDTDAMMAQANQLIETLPKSVYAHLGTLFLAREAVYDGEYETALTYLKWVLQQTKQKPFAQIARLRMARILIAQENYLEAQQILATVDDAKYLPLIEEIRGDIWVALGEIEQARQAYDSALQQLPSAGTTRPVLAMKLYSLPASSPIDVPMESQS